MIDNIKTIHYTAQYKYCKIAGRLAIVTLTQERWLVMKKKIFGALVLSLIVFGLLAVTTMARNTDDWHPCVSCCSGDFQFPFDFDITTLEVADIIDIGNGYFVHVLETRGINFKLAYYTTPFPFGISTICCGVTMSITTTGYHTIRSHPLPRTCISVTVVILRTCTRCWTSKTTTLHGSGCGGDCPILNW